MNLCAVMVTYADRAALCLQAAETAMGQGIGQLIIVDNGSVPASAARLQAFAAVHSAAVQLIPLYENRGSAEGFAAGIRAFLATGADILWMLDDDNLLAPGAVEQMTTAWNELPSGATGHTALAAFRADRYNYVAALDAGDAWKMLPPKNAYDGFHWRQVLRFFPFKDAPASAPPEKGSPVNVLSIPVAAYGGLWIPRELCARHGLPDPAFLLYMDDFDYTWRLTSGGARILLLRDVRIKEIEPSYYLPAKKSWRYHSLLAARSDALAYYTCRNVVYFTGRYLVTDPRIYRLNRLLFRGAITALALLNGKRQRLGVIRRAMRDGEEGRLGLHPDFPL